MIFEKKSVCIIVSLDPIEGSRYTEHFCDYESDDDLDYIYKIRAQDLDWVNPTANGWITWDHEISCTSDSDKEI